MSADPSKLVPPTPAELGVSNNPRANAAAATAAANALANTKQAKTRTAFFVLWAIVAGILLLGGFVWLLNILSVPVAILIWTLIIVFCLRGIVNGLEKRGINRAVGTTLAYIIMFLVLAVIAFMLFSPMFGLSSQFNDLISHLPHYVDAVSAWGNEMYARYSYLLQDDTVKGVIDEIQKSAAGWASSIAQGSASGIMAVSTTVANGFMALGFGLVIAFWILMQLPAIGAETRRIIGPKHRESAEFFHATFTRVMGGYIKGTIIQCALIGVVCGIIFQLIGVPNAAVIGLITGVLNIIPIVGPWLGGVLAAIAAIFASPIVAVIAIVTVVVVQQLVYTFISPRIMQNSVDIHPALMLMALMVGSALGGAMSGLMGSLVGMLASIPLVAVAKSVFVYYFEKKTGRHLVAEDGVFFKGVPSDENEVNPAADAMSPGTTGTMVPIKLEDTGIFKRITGHEDTRRGKGGRHS